MGMIERRATPYPTKTCPRCGAELYADMNICYGCLYDFSRDASRRVEAEMPLASQRPRGDTVDLSAASTALPHADGVGLLVRPPAVALRAPVGAKGVSLGRGPENDVVLHSPAISHRHLWLTPTPDGMEVCDLGSTNPARYHGREVRERVVAPYGDSLDVCGCILTMTGPAPTSP